MAKGLLHRPVQAHEGLDLYTPLMFGQVVYACPEPIQKGTRMGHVAVRLADDDMSPYFFIPEEAVDWEDTLR
ncbi:MAG: hypothetical protein JWO84_434 [Parcubacteria group bacterium]|nr:hypothetical protein [Parcubacteria group bacterium]